MKVAHEAACEVQLRFVETVRGIVANNVLARGVKLRDSATVTTNSNNLIMLGTTFANKFMNPANGDFRLAAGNEADPQIIGKGTCEHSPCVCVGFVTLFTSKLLAP